MISNRSGSHQSEFMQALVPMVDLFAVLAIVFMIHSNEEITVAQAENDERIHEIVAEVQEARKALEAIDELVLCSQSLFRFADLGDDGLCRGGPDKGCGVIVSAIDVVVDRLD